MHPGSYPLTEYKDSSSCLPQLWPNCPALIWKVKRMLWFNPIDMGTSSKGGRGYTKTSLNPSTCLEVARPRKSISTMWSESHSVVSNSLRLQGLYSPWNSPDQNTGVDSQSLLLGIFPTQELNQSLLHCWRILYQLSYQGNLYFL